MPLIRSSIVIGLISTIGLIAFRGDAIWLSLLRPPDDVGIYSVAYRFVDQSLALPAMFLATVFPILTRALHTDRDIASRRINRASQLLALLGILGALAMYSLAPPLVHVIGGAQFEASVRPLRVLALAVPCLFVAPVFYNVLVALDRRLDLAVIAILVLSFDVAVNFTLIPRYGYMGAAIATISTQSFALAALLTCARWRYPFALDLGFVVRVVAAALGAVAILKVVPTESPWVEWISAEGVFLLGVVALGVVRLTDIRLLTERRRPE
jgi:O-antigen/teichoic acid export membrane protein